MNSYTTLVLNGDLKQKVL